MRKLSHRYGQWLGLFAGKKSGMFNGQAILNIDRKTPNEAFIHVLQKEPHPPSRLDLVVEIDGDQFKAVSKSFRVFDGNGTITPEEYVQRHPDRFFLRHVEVTGRFEDNTLKGEWTDDQNIGGEFKFLNSFATPSSPPDKRMSWHRFKSFVGKHIKEGTQLIYRGQETCKWKLDTTFHRAGRYDLSKFLEDDIPELVRRINAETNGRYDLKNPDHLGALLSLAQHHGFPTPLLDWTHSPYVAAYFAFANLRPTATGCARIFMFDARNWVKMNYQSGSIVDPRPKIVVKEFECVGNARHLPQQSIHLFSNVHDVEETVRMFEKHSGKKFLTIIDIPVRERPLVMRELAFMGITAAALFPGLEGVCKTLRERFFNL